MKKAEPTEIQFVSSYDLSRDHELVFRFNQTQKIKNFNRKAQYQGPPGAPKQPHQQKTMKVANLRKPPLQQQRSQPPKPVQITTGQLPQSSQLQQKPQLQAHQSAQTLPLASQASISQQNQNSKNLFFAKNKNVDSNVLVQNLQQQRSIQSSQGAQRPQGSSSEPSSGTFLDTNKSVISLANDIFEALKSINNTSPQQPPQPQPQAQPQQQQQPQQPQQVQTQTKTNSKPSQKVDNPSENNETQKSSDQTKPQTDPTAAPSLNISNNSLAFKNPIYQHFFLQKKSQPQPPQTAQNQTQTQSSQPPQNQPQPPQNQSQPPQPPQIPTLALLQAQLQYIHSLPIPVQLNFFKQQILQQKQLQKYKEQLEASTKPTKKRAKQNSNDEFSLRSDSSRKKAKFFVPASNTMYSTHHKNPKHIQDLSESESDTYIPCTSSSSSPSSSSPTDESEDEDEKEPTKAQPSAHAHHTASSSGHAASHPKKDKKFTYTPFNPRVKLKRRYASWAEITDYGQWKWAAKIRPHIIEEPVEAFKRGEIELEEERSKPLEFDHQFTLLECLKVVSDNLPALTGSEAQTTDSNNKEDAQTTSDANLSKSSSNSNLNIGLSKSDSFVNIQTSDKISLASVITPVLTKRRAQRPDHIMLASIIDNFDGKMRSITCRACNMLDRLLLREILKNSAPMLHQSLQEIASYVWREYQTENLQSSKTAASQSASSRRKKKRTVTLTAALARRGAEVDTEVEDAFHVIKQTFEFLNISEKEETNYECEIRHMNFLQDYTFQPSFADLVDYFRQVKGMFVSRSSSGYILQ